MARRSTAQSGSRTGGVLPAGLPVRGIGLRARRPKGIRPAGRSATIPVPIPRDEDPADELLTGDAVADTAEDSPDENLDDEGGAGVPAAVDLAPEDAVDDLAMEDIPVEELPVAPELVNAGMVGAEGDSALAPPAGIRPAEVNVDSLLAELESSGKPSARGGSQKSARRRLEDHLESRRMARALEDFEDFEV